MHTQQPKIKIMVNHLAQYSKCFFNFWFKEHIFSSDMYVLMILINRLQLLKLMADCISLLVYHLELPTVLQFFRDIYRQVCGGRKPPGHIPLPWQHYHSWLRSEGTWCKLRNCSIYCQELFASWATASHADDTVAGFYICAPCLREVIVSV